MTIGVESVMILGVSPSKDEVLVGQVTIGNPLGIDLTISLRSYKVGISELYPYERIMGCISL